ncbi:MAG TPA: amino acid adenylation domain-containing protein [Pyrinomonadaceae bacterium]|nr:amino acid adenylation domain-containing protein [Pyrinomonadaceae bacterium]
MSSTINRDTESLTRRIDGLSLERRALLERLLKAKGLKTNAPTTKIARRGKSDFIPLSFGQQRLWVLHQLDPSNPAYNMPDAVRLQGALEVAALKRTFEEIVRRHDVLRTGFRMTERGPEQLVAPEQESERFLDFAIVDLSLMEQALRETEAARLASDEAVSPFDLSRGPTLRIRVVRLSPEDHIILFTMHHIATDMWSLNVFAREIMTLYDAFSNGLPSPLPELQIQYADFAAWQREWLQGETLEQQLAYWKEHLQGSPALLELPTDRPRPAVQTFRGLSQPLVLTGELSRSIISLARQGDATLFMTLLAAFYVLLYRYTGQPDIVLGTPMAGRNQAQTEDLIGFFINTLALRAELSGEMTFRQLLKLVREIALGASAHQDLPFEKLVEELQPERSLSYAPIFQVMFALQNVRGEGLELPGLKLIPMLTDGVIAKFDLTLFMFEDGGEIGGSFEYNTDLFDAETIKRMTRHFERLLEGIVAQPDRRIAELPLLTEAEEQRQIVEWNETASPFPSDVRLHHLFEQQVSRTPDAMAVRCGPLHLSYAELNRRADCLASHLVASGVSPETLVAVCLPRSVQLVVSLLAILKAGGAYLPLDLSSPPRRLEAILTEAQPLLLLTVKEWRERLPSDLQTRVVCLDDEGRDDVWPQASSEVMPRVSADNLAYVIYTSGSTGTPKGAMITHRGVVNYLSWSRAAYPLSEGGGSVVHSPIGFDLTVTSLYGPLVAGGCVHLLEESEGVQELAQALMQADEPYSLLKLTPAHLEALSRLIPDEARVQTRAMVIGGEALHRSDVRHWLERAPGVRLINEYGPTETVVGCCVYEVGAGKDVGQVVPIGRAIANTRLYVLDQWMQVVPVGVSGELFVGGAGVGRGYLNRPHVTAERFVPDPYGESGGERLYRTGDLARYRADGEIEYVGRADHQVKVRGYRIELGEIESVLREHEQVREAVVLLKGEAKKEKRLVAYVVPTIEGETTATMLRDDLKETLPAYMIPSAIVLIDAMPLTGNGKVDYRALPDPDEKGAERRNAFVAPRNLLELHIAEIWEDVLNVRPVGATDNFFDLGGHSLLGLRVSALIHGKFGHDLPLSAFFEGGTVEHLASLIRNRTETRPSHLVTLQSGGSRRPIFFIHPIGGGVVCYAYLARHLGAEQPVYALQSLEKDDPHTQVETMAASYILTMREVQPQGPYLLGGWSFGAYVAFEMASQLQRAGEEVKLLAILDNGAPGIDADAAEDDPLSGDDPVALARILESFSNLKEPLPLDEDYLRQLAPDEQILYIMEQAKKARIMPQEITLPQVKRSLHNFRSRTEAARNYAPQVYAGKVTLFRCTEARPLDTEILEADPMWGWSLISSEPVELQVVAGSHESMVAEPFVLDVATKLTTCIDRIEME